MWGYQAHNETARERDLRLENEQLRYEEEQRREEARRCREQGRGARGPAKIGKLRAALPSAREFQGTEDQR